MAPAVPVAGSDGHDCDESPWNDAIDARFVNCDAAGVVGTKLRAKLHTQHDAARSGRADAVSAEVRGLWPQHATKTARGAHVAAVHA